MNNADRFVFGSLCMGVTLGVYLSAVMTSFLEGGFWLSIAVGTSILATALLLSPSRSDVKIEVTDSDW